MSGDDFLALSPLLALATGVCAHLLLIAWIRSDRTAAVFALAYIMLAALCLPLAWSVAPHPVGDLFLVDGFALFLTLVFLLNAAVVALQMEDARFSGLRKGELYLLLQTATLGACALVASRHFASIFISLELMGISLFAMVAYRANHRPSIEAGIKYLVLTGISTALVLMGVGLVYAATGVLQLTPPGEALVAGNGLSRAWLTGGYALLLGGLAFKLSLVPFHFWTPDVYQGAPAPVTAYLATVGKGAAAAILFRLLAGGHVLPLAEVLFWIALFSMLVGNLLAVSQRSLKRLLAYSSVAHMGYLLVAFLALETPGGGLAGETLGFYLAAYLLTTLTAFGVITHLAGARGGREPDDLEDFRGLFWRRPRSALALMLAMLSLAGIPLTIGFLGKFYLFAAGAASGQWTLLWALVVGSAIGLYYYLRVLLVLCDRTGEQSVATERIEPTPGRVTLAVLTLLILWYGIFPESLMSFVRHAVRGIS